VTGLFLAAETSGATTVGAVYEVTDSMRISVPPAGGSVLSWFT